eukprot:TRINITY_DN7072_c1_g1_i1.p1 TRINITY_DN7072_c1_g1~~TRINITY_DN7072_c1_g1_i1.p1  ORF type:complete len:148 (+),score=13.35 TRINITY_DN7072_c1_g1_i1:85-528(+)
MPLGGAVSGVIQSGRAPESGLSRGASTVFEDVPGWSAQRNRVRGIVFTPGFERLWLFVIFANCVFLSVEDPTDKHCDTSRCKVTHVAEFVFTAIFNVEAGLKMLGLGLCRVAHEETGGRDGYFRDAWNVMDFLIVVVAASAVHRKRD